MCLILFAQHAHRDYPLIVAANRDESHARPAAAAAFWQDFPQICGGRDLEMGGTWLGITRSGRFAALTNFRDPNARRNARLSRGELVKDFLAGDVPAERYLGEIRPRGNQYNGFILIAGDLQRLYWMSNRGPDVAAIANGVHGLSNHLLNTPWPKIQRTKQVMQSLLASDEATLIGTLFEVLADRTQAPDHELPDTGAGLVRERERSSVFICDERYGTRASTLILVRADAHVLFIERSYGRLAAPLGEVVHRFDLDAPCA